MSPSLPLVRLDHVLPFEHFLRKLGTPVDRLMTDAGLPLQALGDARAVASAHVVYGFVEKAQRSEGIDDLGALVGLTTRPQELGQLGEPFARRSAAASLHEALLQSFARASRESRRLRLWLEARREKAWLCYSGSLGPGHPGFAIVEQYMIAILVGMVREAAGAGWSPTEVYLRAARDGGLAHTPALGGPRVRTHAPVTAVPVPWPVLRLPLRARAPQRDGHDEQASGELPADFDAALRAALRPYLRDGTASVGTAARLAGTSVRSLQRALASAGLTYSRLLQQVRLETALELIERDNALLVEVAAELGYSDQAHFTRAFARWTGLSPSAYRRELVASSG